MPTLKELENTDELYNPQNERAASLAKQEQQTGEDAGVNAGIDQLESYANDPNNATKNIDAANQAEQAKQGLYTGTGGGTKTRKLTLKENIKKKGPLGGIIGFIVGVPTLISIFLSPALVIQQFTESLTDEFNDQLAAVDARSAAFLKTKYKDKLTSGICNPISIRCKYQTMREGGGLHKRLQKAGITVEYDKGVIPGRIKPTAFVFNGDSIPADQLLDRAKNNAGLRNALRKGYDPLYASFSDGAASRVREKLSIRRTSSVQAGSQDSMNEDLNRTAAGTIDIPEDGEKLKAVYGKDGDGNDIVTGYEDSNGNPYSVEDGEKINRDIDLVNERSLLADSLEEAATKAALKGALTSTAFGLGAADSFCSVWTMIRIAGFAAKIYQQRQLIAYGYEFVKFSHKLKYGDATAEETNFYMSKLVTNTNSEGKGALDSQGYKWTAYDDNFTPGDYSKDIQGVKEGEDVTKYVEGLALQNETSKYVNGQLVSTSLMADIAGYFADDGSNSVKSADKACGFLKSWQGQVLVFGVAALGAVAAFFSGGATVSIGAVAQAAVSVTISVAFALLQPKLMDMAKGEVIKGDENSNQVGNAIVSGMGGYNAQASQQRGLGVATKEVYASYSQYNNEIAAKYAKEDRDSRSPLDPTSKNTFVGSILYNLTPNLVKMQTIGSTMLSASSLVSSSVAAILTPYTARAAADKYDSCDDPEYDEFNLAADPFCNLRYAIPKSDLSIDPEVVLDFMLRYELRIDPATGEYIIDPETGEPKKFYLYLKSPTEDIPVGDYAAYIQKCIDRETSIGDALSDTSLGDGKECTTGGGNDGQNRMFRLYYLDSTIRAGMDDDFPEDAPLASSNETNAASSGKTGEDLDLRVATFNAGGNPKPNEDMIKKMVETLEKNQPNIIGFQEFNDGWSAAALDPSRVEVRYAMYPEAGSVNPIVYNKDDFDLVKGGMMPNLKYFNGAKLEAPYVLLRHKESGQEMYVLNTHDPAKPENADLRLQNARQHVKFIKSLDKGIPIIFPGDFNSGYSLRSEGNTTAGNNPENLTYCILTKDADMNDAFDLANDRPKKCPNPGNENTVDHIYLSDGISVNDYFRDYGGDVHDSHYADITIEGSGGSGDITWPFDKKWWIQARADFLDSHSGAGTYTSPNTDGIAVDIGTPPDGTPVYAIAGGKVVKRPLGRSSRTCVGTPNPDHNGGLMIESNIQGGKLLVAYAHGQAVTTKDTVEAGEQIMEVGNVGNSCGGHLHLDMSFNNKNICPQDVFLALDKGGPINLTQLASKAGSSCGR